MRDLMVTDPLLFVIIAGFFFTWFAAQTLTFAAIVITEARDILSDAWLRVKMEHISAGTTMPRRWWLHREALKDYLAALVAILIASVLWPKVLFMWATRSRKSFWQAELNFLPMLLCGLISGLAIGCVVETLPIFWSAQYG